MATRKLTIQITGPVSPSDAAGPVAQGAYLATEIQPPSPRGPAADLRSEPVAQWRLRKIDSDGRLLPSGPAFILTFRQLAAYIEARHMRVIAGDFV
jgi:hypothetical protein